MSRLGVRKFLKYAARFATMRSYFRSPGDGRVRPQIPAVVFLRVLLAARLLREVSFLGAEELVRSPARRAIGVRMSFGDDALEYFTERLSADRLREATVGVARKAKRNKAFQDRHNGVTGSRIVLCVGC